MEDQKTEPELDSPDDIKELMAMAKALPVTPFPEVEAALPIPMNRHQRRAAAVKARKEQAKKRK